MSVQAFNMTEQEKVILVRAHQILCGKFDIPKPDYTPSMGANHIFYNEGKFAGHSEVLYALEQLINGENSESIVQAHNVTSNLRPKRQRPKRYS